MLAKIVVKKEDFFAALREMHPASLREVLIESPNLHWSEIGGLAEAKKELIEAVEWPLKYGMLFDKMDAKPPKGILLYGLQAPARPCWPRRWPRRARPTSST